jgi:hypothetical protein
MSMNALTLRGLVRLRPYVFNALWKKHCHAVISADPGRSDRVRLPPVSSGTSSMTHRFSTLALARAARLLVAALVAAAAAPTVALAQVPEPMYQEALTVIAQYGRDASVVVPCATMAGLGDTNPKIVNQWDEVSVRQALDKFAQQRGASPEQVAALYKAFEDNYRPNFEVGDLRKFARACWDSEIIIGLYVVKGPTVPLQYRPPFVL